MIAIVKAEFNKEVTDLLLEGCVERLNEKQVPNKIFTCPGAVETVSYARRLMKNPAYEAIIIIGAIIKGDTDHYEYVCQFVTQGVSYLSAQSDIPLIFGVLTTQTEELAMARALPDQMNKGAEFADTAIFMTGALKRID
jgi:6,7-dimethyl-8-ribityllumazine synthase